MLLLELPDEFYSLDFELKLQNQVGIMLDGFANKVHECLKRGCWDFRESDAWPTVILPDSTKTKKDFEHAQEKIRNRIIYTANYDGDWSTEAYRPSGGGFAYNYNEHQLFYVALRGYENLQLEPGIYLPDRDFLRNWRNAKYINEQRDLGQNGRLNEYAFLPKRGHETTLLSFDTLEELATSLWVRPLSEREHTAVSRHKIENLIV